MLYCKPIIDRRSIWLRIAPYQIRRLKIKKVMPEYIRRLANQ